MQARHFLRARLAAGVLPLLPLAAAAAAAPAAAPASPSPLPAAAAPRAASYAAFMRAMFSLLATAWSTMGLRGAREPARGLEKGGGWAQG